MIVSIARAGEMLILYGNMRLQQDDRLTSIGSLEALNDAQKMLEA